MFAPIRRTPGQSLKPPKSDLHEFAGCTGTVGQPIELDITEHPDYQGGEIGFFLASNSCSNFDSSGSAKPTLDENRIFYSEQQFNPDGLVHLLIWQSVATPDSFYFGWEGWPGNTNLTYYDFDDLLIQVTGIQCAEGGGACSVPGQKGICEAGVEQCVAAELECVQVVEPTSLSGRSSLASAPRRPARSLAAGSAQQSCHTL